MASFSKAGDDFGDMNGIPDQDGVGQKAQATGLVHNLGQVSGSKFALIGFEKFVKVGIL